MQRHTFHDQFQPRLDVPIPARGFCWEMSCSGLGSPAVSRGEKYTLPKTRKDYAGIVVSLTRQEWPDTNQFNDPEIAWRMTGKNHHIGLIVQAKKRERVLELLDDYAARIQRDYHASAPAPDKPTN